MNTFQKIEKSKELFERLKKILEDHRGKNHIMGIRSIIAVLSDDEVIPDERIDHARSNFKYMMGGMGTLGDYAISDENKTVQLSLNHDLDQLLTELWDLLEC